MRENELPDITNVGVLGPVITADGSKPGNTSPLAPEWMNAALPTAGEWSGEQALKVVLRDFGNAETFRMQNHDWRWRNADQTYLAWITQKFWEGTQIPRASLQVHQAFQQIESLLPQVMAAIFQVEAGDHNRAGFAGQGPHSVPTEESGWHQH